MYLLEQSSTASHATRPLPSHTSSTLPWRTQCSRSQSSAILSSLLSHGDESWQQVRPRRQPQQWRPAWQPFSGKRRRMQQPRQKRSVMQRQKQWRRRRRANSRSRSLVESRWHCSSKQQQLSWPPAESSPIMGCFWLELHPLVCGLCGQPHSGRPAGRLCFPPLPSQVRSRPTTSSARAAGDLAAPSRWSRAAPSPSATFRARVDDVLRACWRGRGGARDGGSRPPRTRRVAVRGARGRARAGRTRTAAVGSSASACGCPARARVSVACTCTVRRLRGREPRLTFSVGRELAVCGLSLRATVVCT